MKPFPTPEINKILLVKLLAIVVLGSAIGSCDTLKSNPGLTNQTGASNVQIYGVANGSTLINLSNTIQTGRAVTFTITSSPHFGSLTSLGMGILQYTPNPGVTQDAIGFSLSQNNVIIKKDSIIILLQKDSTTLPCGIYPATDYVYNVSRDSSRWINVLANDYICPLYSGDVTLSIVSNSDFPYPIHGTARIVNSGIQYTPGSSFSGTDSILYEIQSIKYPNQIAYGMVYILTQPICTTFTLASDQYSYSVDSLLLNHSKVFLPVYNNDALCDPLKSSYTYSIINPPMYGTATINAGGIYYALGSQTLPTGNFMDSLNYQVCHYQVCLKAKVIINLRN